MKRGPKALIFRGLSEAHGILNPTQTNSRILCYHKTADTRSHFAGFKIQILEVKDRILPLDRVLHERQASTRSISITFDDGYAEIATSISPLLHEHEIHHHLFISPGRLDKQDFITRLQLKDLSTSRFISFGAHGLHHKNLKKCSDRELREEIADSKKLLEDITGTAVNSFAYPYGALNEKALELVAQSGYQYAFTSRTGDLHATANPFLIRRTEIFPGESNRMFNLKLHGAWDWHARRQSWLDRYEKI